MIRKLLLFAAQFVFVASLAQDYQTNLVANWSMNDVLTPTVDESVNNHDGVNTGAVSTYSGTRPPVDLFLAMDGADYVTVPDVADLQMYTSDFTITFGVYQFARIVGT